MRILVVDAMNIGHIMFHSMGELDYHGRRTGVVFGFLSKVLQLAERFTTNHFVFAWDSQQSLRRCVYEAYKDSPKRHGVAVIRGTDEIMDYQALHDQMAELYDSMLGSLGFRNVIRWTGLEADDVIGGVVKYAQLHPRYGAQDFVEWIIVSTDRDLYQLLRPDVRMYNVSSKKEFTDRDFKSRYGIEPEQWVEAKAMGGCYTDNIAGIVGISDPAKSEKSRALSILRGELTKGTYVDKLKSPLGRYVVDRNRVLVSLPYPGAPHDPPVLMPDVFDRGAFAAMFDQLGFDSFLKPERWEKWEAYFNLNGGAHGQG